MPSHRDSVFAATYPGLPSWAKFVRPCGADAHPLLHRGCGFYLHAALHAQLDFKQICREIGLFSK